MTVPSDPSRMLLGDHDLYLFNEGTHYRLFQKLGAHPMTQNGVVGTHFAVWAPGAERVSVLGDFNFWNTNSHPLKPVGSSGIWAGFLPEITVGTLYKYYIKSHTNGYEVQKADPFAFSSELPPKTASVVADLTYEWQDQSWMRNRGQNNDLKAPMSIYELHLGSWQRDADGNFLNYRQMAEKLVEHIQRTGFTHVELMPITEHPFYGSWGYQTTGFFAATSRYGTPTDLKYFIDYLHQHGIGVILDWVPSHFPNDEHGIAFFDGTHLYEHADPRQGYHPDWGSVIFNYGRHEVRSFLLSSAIFWLEEYHFDGLRVDAVASMLYLDYSRKSGEWIPNVYGGNENLEAISFLRTFNEVVYREFPDVQTIAEESTAWSQVSRPTSTGGLGFGLKWDMGWMHDTLKYLARDPIHRTFHQNELSFRTIYAFSENFVLPLSHDEVVHGKHSLLSKMPGDDWQKFANLRALYGYMYGQPGKKLLFMGAEWGQWDEWKHDESLPWHQRNYPPHAGVERWITDLNAMYRKEPAMHQRDCHNGGFEWIDASDAGSSVYSFMRLGDDGRIIVVVCNFTPIVRTNYRVGVPYGGFWQEILNSDATVYWGSGQGNSGGMTAQSISWNGRPYSLNLTLPPLSVVFFKGN